MVVNGVWSILVAAGVGARLAAQLEGRPKQFVQLGGRALYQWSLLTLCHHKEIEHTVVMTLPEMVERVQQEVEDLGLSDTVAVCAGGASRQATVRLGLEQIKQTGLPAEIVIVHDAARPFITGDLIDATIQAVRRYGACTTATLASDTVKIVEGEFVSRTLDRDTLVLVQTPQGARFDYLVAAHELGKGLNAQATDDAALLEAAGYPVAVVRGSKLNLKITEPEDLFLAEAMLK